MAENTVKIEGNALSIAQNNAKKLGLQVSERNSSGKINSHKKSEE